MSKKPFPFSVCEQCCNGDVSQEQIQEAVNNYLDGNPITTTETDPTVPEWAKQPNKPTYTANEVGAYSIEQSAEIHRQFSSWLGDLDAKTDDIKDSLEEHGQELSKKTEETILYEEVVNTPVWTNQPTYDGTLEFDTSDYYYVTLKNTDGTALPSGQFKLMPMYDKYAEAYETVFTLAGLKTGNSGTLTENLPVEVTSDYKMRNAGVQMVTASFNLPMDSNLGKLTIRTTGQFIKIGKTSYFGSGFSTNTNVAHYNSGSATTSNSEGDKTIWHFVNNQGDDYKVGKIMDTLELRVNGEKSFITHRHSLLRYIGYGTTTYKNIASDTPGFGFILSEDTEIQFARSYSVNNNGYIRNGSVFTVTEVK